MTNSCTGICERYSPKTSHSLGQRRYLNGHKRCTICEIWMVWEGFRCPCCKGLLRFKPRRREEKEYYNEVMKNL